MEKQIGAVLTYYFSGHKGVCGNTVGADGSGEKAVVFYGTPVAAANAAYLYCKRLQGSPGITNVVLVINEEQYLGFPLIIIDSDKYL